MIVFLKKELAEKEKTNQSLREEITKLKLIIAENFIEQIGNANIPKTTTQKSFAQVLKNTQTAPSAGNNNQRTIPKIASTKKNTCALILQPSEPIQGLLNLEVVSAVKKSIEKSLKPTDINFEILEFKSNHRGQIIAILPSEQDQANASNKLTKLGSSLNFTVEMPKKKLPRMRISGIPADTQDLITELKQSNPVIETFLLENPNESLKLVTLLSDKNNFIKNAVIGVSSGLRNLITKSWRLKLGMCSYPVFNHVHIRQCGKCQKFGHAADGPNPCRAPKPTCGICAEEHFTSACPGYNADGSNKSTKPIQKKCSNCCSSDHGAIERTSCPLFAKKKNEAIDTLNRSND